MPEAADPSEIQIYVCSSNSGKLIDFSFAATACCEAQISLRPLPGLKKIAPPAENGDSFLEIAAAKAVYYSSFTSGLVLADDSGLEVEALRRAPGVYSARYAGADASDAHNNQLLLSNLAGVGQRDARFVCALALARDNKVLLTAEGFVEGNILNAPAGGGGFGYDPLFFYPPLQRSFGELAPEDKLSVSHRGRALRLLFQQLPGMLL